MTEAPITPEPEISPEEAASDIYAVTPELVGRVLSALEGGDSSGVRALIRPLHAADLADLIEFIAPDERKHLFELVGGDLSPDALSELGEAARDDILELFEPRDLAAVVTELEIDDAVSLLEDMDEAQQREVLDAVPADERGALEEGLAYPEDTAGRLMQRDLIAVPAFWTVGQTIDHLREADDLPDIFHEIFVVDPAHRPVGSVALSTALRTKRPVTISEIMGPELHTVPVAMEQEEVAYLFRQYDLLSAPVVDDADRLLGVLLVDDMVDVIREEVEEDAFRLAGVADGDLNEGVVETTRTRFSWLLLNLLTAILASVVIAFFGASIEKLVALAILMPIVASMGGNAATQTMTVAVRALATHELTAANATRIVVKEVLVGGMNGLLFAVLTGAVGGFWFQDAALGLVLGAAMVINMVVAGLAGILVPLTLERAGVDPAVASTVFVTTITDVFGFAAFLGLAAWLLV